MEQKQKPAIVCLCGSTRFRETFDKWNRKLTYDGKIVLSIEPAGQRESVSTRNDPELKNRLNWLHLRKIDLADEVMVLNVNGYIGESTRREIDYATGQGKPVSYLEDVQ